MKLIERTKCVISLKEDLEPLYTFKKFPVFMGCTEKPTKSDRKADMSWYISKSSGLIQLKYLLPLSVLYPESHGAGCVGDLWNQHHNAFAKFIGRYKPKAVLEIGGSHGILANEYSKEIENSWTILEPNPAPVLGCNAHFIKGFFNDKFQYSKPFDAIVHSHVFEHIYDQDEFMHHLANFMTEGKHLFFSIPNMEVMLARKYTNCINFEHSTFLTEPYVEYLLARYGFKILNKEYFKDDHSIFYATIRDSGVKPIKLATDLYKKNKKLYQDYVSYHENLIYDLNKIICLSRQPIYLFGAHVFAQYLISFGLDTSRIISLLDNDINKRGKRLYGSSLYVNLPNILKSADSPIVILKAGVYNDEIKTDILNNINSSVEFWE